MWPARRAYGGLSQEASTGEFPPLQMLMGTSEPGGQQLQQQLSSRFARHWQHLVSRHWCQLDHELLLAICDALPSSARLDDDDRRDLTNFAYGFRGFELTLPVLQELSACKGMAHRIQSHPEAKLWCRAVLQAGPGCSCRRPACAGGVSAMQRRSCGCWLENFCKTRRSCDRFDLIPVTG